MLCKVKNLPHFLSIDVVNSLQSERDSKMVRLISREIILFLQISNLCDHDTSTSQTDRRTDRQLALAIPRSTRLRAVKTTTTDHRLFASVSLYLGTCYYRLCCLIFSLTMNALLHIVTLY